MKRSLRITLAIVLHLFLLYGATPAKTISSSPNQGLTPPAFPGDEAAFKKYLYANLKWPEHVEDVQGIFIIFFYVESDGRLTGIRVAKSFIPEFDAEALRVIKASPRWIPARRGNIPIRSKYSVPIKFYLAQ